MAAPKPRGRRIVPMRIGDGSASQDAMPLADASNDALQSPPHIARQLDLREQAAIAKQKLGPGRRIFVDIQNDGSIVDWHKLMKAAGVGKAPASPGAGPADAPTAPDDLFKEPSRPKNAFSSVIQRLEQAYVMNDGDGSRSSEQESVGRADSGQSAEEEGDDKRGGESAHESGREGAPGAAKPKRAAATAGGVPKDDQYDYEDNFIDDSEIIEYYAGDRRKAKHSGFFVNSGEIEKTGELIDKQEASPKKRRKKAPGAGDVEEGAPAAKRLKHDDAPATGVPATMAVPETRDGFEQTAASASLAHLTAGAEPSGASISHHKPVPSGQTSARKRKPAGAAADAPGTAGDKPYVIGREARAVIAALQQLAAAEAASAPPEGANKKIPESLRLALSKEFIGPYMRDVNRHKDAQSVLVAALMEFLEPFTTRNNLMRLLSQWKGKTASEYELAKSVLRDHLSLGCTAAEAKAGAQGAAARASFDWTPELLSTLLAFVHLRGLVKGKAMIENGRIWGQIADLFDRKLMDAASVKQAYSRALAAGLPRTVGVRPSATVPPAPVQAAASAATRLPATVPVSAPAQVAAIMQQATPAAATPAAPAISPASGLPALAAKATPPAPVLPPPAMAQALQLAAAQAALPPLRTGSVGGGAPLQPAMQSPLQQAGAQTSNPASAGVENSNAASAAAEVDPAPHLAAGLLLGGDAQQLDASTRAFAKGSMKALVNLTLMHAGSKGFKTADIVEKAAAAGIADWRADRSKRSYLSSVMSKEPSFVNVGTYHYALRAFPGVTEAGAAVERGKAAALEAQAVAGAAATALARQGLPHVANLATSAPAQAVHPVPTALTSQAATVQTLPPHAASMSSTPQPPQADTNLG